MNLLFLLTIVLGDLSQFYKVGSWSQTSFEVSE